MGRSGGVDTTVPSDTGELPGYFAQPASGRGPGVVVVHAEWGLGDSVRAVCDRLARAGFVALAVDLFGGARPAARAEADRRADELDVSEAARSVDAGVAELVNRDATEGNRVAVLGFGLGGALALDVAVRSERVGAVSSFYPGHPDISPALGGIEVPVLAVFAGDAASAEAAKSLEAALDAAGVRSSVQVREGTRSGFMDPALPDRHDAAAAEAGWIALEAFFHAELA